MTTKVLPSGQHAVLAIDPGGTTGVFAGYVDLDPGSLKDTLLSIRRRKAIEVQGDWLSQAHKIAGIMNQFVFVANVEQGLPWYHMHIVFEDFILLTGPRGEVQTTNLTSIWAMAGAVTIYHSKNFSASKPIVPIDYQSASDAKSKAKNERLKLWGLWEVGSEHKRDAARHFALRVDRLLLGK